MARSVSMYEQYWVLLKQHRGQWLELQVPAEYQERVVKALRKRKGKEHATTAHWYSDFEVIRQPIHPVTKEKQAGILMIRLPIDLIHTI